MDFTDVGRRIGQGGRIYSKRRILPGGPGSRKALARLLRWNLRQIGAEFQGCLVSGGGLLITGQTMQGDAQMVLILGSVSVEGDGFFRSIPRPEGARLVCGAATTPSKCSAS